MYSLDLSVLNLFEVGNIHLIEIDFAPCAGIILRTFPKVTPSLNGVSYFGISLFVFLILEQFFSMMSYCYSIGKFEYITKFIKLALYHCLKKSLACFTTSITSPLLVLKVSVSLLPLLNLAIGEVKSANSVFSIYSAARSSYGIFFLNSYSIIFISLSITVLSNTGEIRYSLKYSQASLNLSLLTSKKNCV